MCIFLGRVDFLNRFWEQATTGCLPRRTFSLGGKLKGKNKAATLLGGKVLQKGDKLPGGELTTTNSSENMKELTLSKESLVLDRRRKRTLNFTQFFLERMQN